MLTFITLAETQIGPYTLGDTLRLRCMSTQGRPLPNVTWWRDNAVLIDDSFETQLGSQSENVINDLVISNLDRYHNGVSLTCRASNDLKVPPASAAVKVRMHCKWPFFWLFKAFLGLSIMLEMEKQFSF